MSSFPKKSPLGLSFLCGWRDLNLTDSVDLLARFSLWSNLAQKLFKSPINVSHTLIESTTKKSPLGAFFLRGWRDLNITCSVHLFDIFSRWSNLSKKLFKSPKYVSHTYFDQPPKKPLRAFFLRGWRDLNPRPPAWQAGALTNWATTANERRIK